MCGAFGLAWRAVELQLKDHEFLAGQGDARFSRVAEITATRGTITDRYGEPLAVSTPVDSVWVNPKELALASDQLPRLAKALKRDKNELARRVTSNLDREFLYLARHMQPAEAQKIRALEIPGVYLMREYRRYYPAGEVAGHILGFTSIDDEGQEGLELAFDHWLAGEDGAKRVIQDRYGKIVQNVEEIRAMRAGAQSRAVDRPAHPVSRVPRVEGRDSRPARQVRLGHRARRRHRRSARHGEPAGLQPE